MIILATFNLSAANALFLVQSIKLPFGKELKHQMDGKGLTLCQTTSSKSLQTTISNVMKVAKSSQKRVENTVGKGEIARYEQFLFFPQCFQKTYTDLNQGLFGKGLNPLFRTDFFLIFFLYLHL